MRQVVGQNSGWRTRGSPQGAGALGPFRCRAFCSCCPAQQRGQSGDQSRGGSEPLWSEWLQRQLNSGTSAAGKHSTPGGSHPAAPVSSPPQSSSPAPRPPSSSDPPGLPPSRQRWWRGGRDGHPESPAAGWPCLTHLITPCPVPAMLPHHPPWPHSLCSPPLWGSRASRSAAPVLAGVPLPLWPTPAPRALEMGHQQPQTTDQGRWVESLGHRAQKYCALGWGGGAWS